MTQMLGWLVAEAACASRRNRCLAPSSWLHCGGRNLSATVPLLFVSSALYTTPIPPPPSLARISYWKTRLPIRGSSGAFVKLKNHGPYTTPRHHRRLAFATVVSGRCTFFDTDAHSYLPSV